MVGYINFDAVRAHETSFRSILLGLLTPFLASCQSYEYVALGASLHDARISCSSETQEAEFRSWIEEHEPWLLDRLTDRYASEQEIGQTLKGIERRIKEQSFSGCETTLLVSKDERGFLGFMPARAIITSELNFQNNEACLSLDVRQVTSLGRYQTPETRPEDITNRVCNDSASTSK